MKYSGAIILALAMSGVGRGAEPTTDQAMQRFAEQADESRRQNEHYLEKRRQEETIDALHDIEDAIIFDSLNEGDD